MRQKNCNTVICNQPCKNKLSNCHNCHTLVYCLSQMSQARAFNISQVALEMVTRLFLCGKGERSSRRPSAQARNRSPLGLAIGSSPLSRRVIRGRPSSKAARVIAFSPGLMAGETNTAPSRAAANRFAFSFSSRIGSMLREMRTRNLRGADNKDRLPTAEQQILPHTLTSNCTRRNSGLACK